MLNDNNKSRSRDWAMPSLRRHMVIVVGCAIALVGGVGGWAGTTELSSAVIAHGVVVVDENVKKIQHLNGGIVSQILVREGDSVKAGQKLFRLDGADVKADLGIVESTLGQLLARRSRLRAELLGETALVVDEDMLRLPEAGKFIDSEQKQLLNRRSAMAGMKSQLASRQQQLDTEIQGLTVRLTATSDSMALIVTELKSLEQLYTKGLVTLQRVSALKRSRADLEGSTGENIAARAQAEGRKSEISLQILQLDEDRRAEISKDLTEAEANIAQYRERRRAAVDQLTRLDIVSPVNGRVLQLATHTVNGVIKAGETMMLVVPENQRLTIDAKIETRDIDQVHIGQPVRIRFSAFDQRTTPEVDGEIATIAADIVTDEATHATYYPVRIYPSPESVAKLQQRALYPGMPAEVFIKIGERSVISYLMKPLSDQMQHAFREE